MHFNKHPSPISVFLYSEIFGVGQAAIVSAHRMKYHPQTQRGEWEEETYCLYECFAARDDQRGRRKPESWWRGE